MHHVVRPTFEKKKGRYFLRLRVRGQESRPYREVDGTDEISSCVTASVHPYMMHDGTNKVSRLRQLSGIGARARGSHGEAQVRVASQGTRKAGTCSQSDWSRPDPCDLGLLLHFAVQPCARVEESHLVLWV